MEIEEKGSASGQRAADEEPLIAMSFRLPESVQYVAVLRKTAQCFLEGAGVSREDIDDVELMIGELATNAVRHAQSSIYHVELDLFLDRVVITVRDEGVGFSNKSIEPPGERPFDNVYTEEEIVPRIGGFGLPMVGSVADQLDISPNQPQGTVVRAEKQLRRN